MEVCRYVAASALALGISVPLHGQAPPTSDAPHVLAAAREALGGESRLSAIHTFIATGRTRRVRGNNLVPVEFELTCELPDKYLRKDESPAQDTDITVSGFNGNGLIQSPALPSGPGGSAGSSIAAQRLTTVKQDFARLMLGIFATSFPSYPVTFTYAALGEAPEGQADILDVAGGENFAARLVIQRASHLPVMLMWQAPAAPAGGRGVAPPATGATLVEHRLYYGDFRDVSGVKWPFRIRRSIAGETVEETTFDRVRLNARIDPRKFEAPK